MSAPEPAAVRGSAQAPDGPPGSPGGAAAADDRNPSDATDRDRAATAADTPDTPARSRPTTADSERHLPQPADGYSQFSFRQIAALTKYSVNTPLRVIAHIDLDAFYAQCESNRLGLPPETPLACQQWDGLIAINYAARAYGITRHERVPEAKRKCPELVLAHVATWREGDEVWQYRPDPDIRTDKVSLDPYRRTSRAIFAVLHDECERVQYAGLDEAYLDLSRLVHARLETRPELAPYFAGTADPDDPLPRPATAVEWSGVVEPADEDAPLDWADVCVALGAEIVAGIRARIRRDLRCTSSAGIAPNRVLAKLCSARHKPNDQTVLRLAAVERFLRSVRFSKIGGLGGKLGEDVAARLDVPEEGSIPHLLEQSLPRLTAQLGDETARWLYDVVRGRDLSEVVERPAEKSMLSAKSFRPAITTPEQATRWLRIFVADIIGRLPELRAGADRRPTKLTLAYRTATAGRSKIAAVPTVRPEALAETLNGVAAGVLRTLLAEDAVLPCIHMSLAVGGLEDAGRNAAIGDFFVPRKRAAEPDPAELCDECGRPVPEAEKAEHADWHFARTLQRQLADDGPRPAPRPPRPPPSPGRRKPKLEKGQRRLFG
ncbi:uncharacterized protein V1510DRAFT_392607 [Dipodascopsis tothii]|uniref:uncharacterized protein n=1 Tax=Dipodascopsis tothii TaxID=44089 RepID=UPI0034CF7096